LLRESYRENGKVKKRTLANLSELPAEIIERVRHALAGPVQVVSETVSGAVFAVLFVLHGRARHCGLQRALGPSRLASLTLFLVLARIAHQGSRLSAARCDPATQRKEQHRRQDKRRDLGERVWQPPHLSRQQVHDRYQDLQEVERNFRRLKSAFLELRPIFVGKESRTRGHVLIAMLALKVLRLMEPRLRSAFGTIATNAEAETADSALSALSRLCLQHDTMGH